MIDYMGGDEEAYHFFEKEPPAPHTFPFHYLEPHHMDTFLRRVKLCTLQYTAVKPITAAWSLVVYFLGSESEAAEASYIPILIINNASVSLALYYLMAFYKAAKPSVRFQAANPFHKFLSVKLIVFFSFWQYMVLDIGLFPF